MDNYIILKNGETNELKLKYVNMSELYNKFKIGNIHYKTISFSNDKINIKDIFSNTNIFITNINYKNSTLTPMIQFNDNVINNLYVKNMILPILGNIELINILIEKENELVIEYIYYNIYEYILFFYLNYQCIILDSEYFKSNWFILCEIIYELPTNSYKIKEIHKNINKDNYAYKSLNFPYYYLNKLNIMSNIHSLNLLMENDISYQHICNAASEEIISYCHYDQYVSINNCNHEVYFIIPRNADLIENITIPYIKSIKDIKLKIHYYGKDYIKSINYIKKNNELILDLYFFPLICALQYYKIYLIFQFLK